MMADQPSADGWAELRLARPNIEDAFATLPVATDRKDTGIAMAMDDSGYLCLIVPVTHGPRGPKPSDLNGLKVRHARLENGSAIVLSAPPSHERVFTPFCREVIDAVTAPGRDPWAAVASTIRAWQAAWRPARADLDKTTQVGLFGELLVLNTLMLPSLGPGAIDQWSGPLAERHDFVGGLLHLEVKTTRKNRAEHEISRIDQLRVPHGCRLLFVSIQLEESIGGTRTLTSLIDTAVDALRNSSGELDAFQMKLAQVGWSEEMRESGELLRFEVRDATVYEVDEAFPRIPDDFIPPTGVVSVRYTVDLANLPSLGLEEVRDIIRSANALKIA